MKFRQVSSWESKSDFVYCAVEFKVGKAFHQALVSNPLTEMLLVEVGPARPGRRIVERDLERV